MPKVFGYVLIAIFLFGFLALPATLVMGPVQWNHGLSWAASTLFLTLFVLLLPGHGLVIRLLAIVTLFLFALINTALAISFVMQGAAFNNAFFSHLDLSTFRIAVQTDAPRLLAAVGYLVITPAVAVFCAGRWRKRARGGRFLSFAAVAALIVAIVTSYPLQSLMRHHQLTRQSSERLLAEIEALKITPQATSGTGQADKNLVLIYLEGLEQNFLDETLFAGLTPNLNQLRTEAIWFDNIHQFPGARWTIGGIVGSQCGVPLLSQGQRNQILASVDNPFSQITCLAEFLQNDGFQTVYLGGATLEFAGKGRFLKDNGYARTLGLDELPAAARQKWGLYDSDLFDYGNDLFDALAVGKSPFLLTLLTLDTHPPEGTPSPGCPSYEGDRDAMLSAVHCTDFLVGEFVEHVRRSSVADNTVIAFVSDHLMMKGSPLDRLAQKERRLNVMLLDPSRQAAQLSGPATHFDIAPTLLDAVGLADAAVPFGHSLLRNEAGRVFERNLTEDDFQGFKIETLVGQSNLEDGVAYFPDEGRLEIGDKRYFTLDAVKVHLAPSDGDRKQFFALVFDDIDDKYPGVFSAHRWLREELDQRRDAVVVAVSDDEDEFCFSETTCESGRFLVIYDLASGQVIRATIPDGDAPLKLSADAIQKLAAGL